MKSEAVKKAADDLRKSPGNREKSPVISGLFSICENNTKNTSRDIISERIKNIPKNYVYDENELTNVPSFANMMKYDC